MAPRILALVMAGGEGTRLRPLTEMRSKPSVPFAGRYRIVDFVLSNFVNSRIYSIYLLVQYKSQSLIDHIQNSWVLPSLIPGQFITVVPPQMREGPEWFQGTADAVYQNRNLILSHRADLVAVFGADHIYRMDVQQMVRFHLRRGADVTVAALPVPRKTATAFGVISVDADDRVLAFEEKPADPPAMPGRPDRAYASMGNYLFNTEVLMQALDEAKRRGESDFGRHLLPRLRDSRKVFAYDFSRNRIPGVRDYEEPAYWRDIGTIDAYYAANMDTLGPEPRFNLFNPYWQIKSSNYQGPNPALIDARVTNSSIGAGTAIKGGMVRNSIIRREVLIETEVEIEDSIIMDYCIIRRGTRLRRVIADRYNQIPTGSRIGYDRDADALRYLVTPSGITVIPKGEHSGAFRYG